MRRCRACKKPIEHLHKNRKICHQCEKKNKSKYQEQMVWIPISRLNELLAAEKHLEFLERLE